MKKMVMLILTAALLTTLLVGTAAADVTAKLATGAMPDAPISQALTLFAERASELTEGRVQFEICDITVMGDELAYLEQLKTGDIGVARVSMAYMKALSPAIEVFGLPYMFKDNDEMYAVIDGEVGQRALSSLNAHNLQGLGFADNGSRAFYTVNPIAGVGDFAGLKLRVQQIEPMTSMISALGATPVNVPAFDLYTAIEGGTCDGAENNLTSILAMDLHKVAKHITLDNHTATLDTISMNLDLWNALGEGDQAFVMQAMAEAKAMHRELMTAAAEANMQQLTDGGAVLAQPDDAALAAMHGAMAPVYEAYSATHGEWIDAIDTALGR